MGTNSGTSQIVGNITVTPTFTFGGLGCAGNTASVSVSVNPMPGKFNMTGGGSYCDYSQTGSDVGLDGSQTGISYQLYVYDSLSSSISTVGIALSGTGFA